MTKQLPEGWYPSPDGKPYERYWDGCDWCEETRPMGAPQPRVKRMVTREPVRTSHTFHLLMTIFTFGIWGIFVWLPITLINSMRTKRVVTKVKY
jgi:hypothetical protein